VHAMLTFTELKLLAALRTAETAYPAKPVDGHANSASVAFILHARSYVALFLYCASQNAAPAFLLTGLEDSSDEMRSFSSATVQP